MTRQLFVSFKCINSSKTSADFPALCTNLINYKAYTVYANGSGATCSALAIYNRVPDYLLPEFVYLYIVHKHGTMY